MDKPIRIDSNDDATRRVQGTDRTHTAEEIARHIVGNQLRVYNVTIQQVEQLAQAYLELIDSPPKPVMHCFVPRDDDLEERRPDLWELYRRWQKKAWFIENERAMNYDFHFNQRHKTEAHYQEWAKKQGLKIKVKP